MSPTLTFFGYREDGKLLDLFPGCFTLEIDFEMRDKRARRTNEFLVSGA
jgi:hypothetical protein